MALTRKMLKAMGIEDEKIDQIIEAHTDVTEALKADRDKYKEDAEKLPTVQKELDDAKKEADAAKNDGYKEKYEAEKQAFADYKKGIESEKAKANKVTAYKALLKKAGVAEKHIDLIVKASAIDEMELDADGNIKDAEEREKSIKDEYSAYIPTISEQGADTENPPSGLGGGRTTSRAAQIVAKHNERLYGVPTKGEEK